jgi:hypothetical protein
MNGTLKDGIPVPKGRKVNPGDTRYADLNNDGEIWRGDNTIQAAVDPKTGEVIPGTGPGDRKIIGNSQRRYQFGLFANAEYKGFDFSLMLNGVGKRDMWLSSPLIFPYMHEFAVMYANQLDYWTPDNTDAYYPRNYALGGVNGAYNRQAQTKYLTNGAYMRIKNITLGYTLPKVLLKKVKIDRLRFYVAVENVADFNSWAPGINTELKNKGQGATYPYMRGYSIGLNLTF